MKSRHLLFMFLFPALCQLYARESKEDISKQAANPIAELISLPFLNNLNGSYGEYKRNVNVLNIQPGDWTFGALINNAWSVAGNSDREDVNHMLLNLFIVKQLGERWYVNSAPIITADWTADPEDRWIVPPGSGGGKLVFLGGKLPLNFQTQFYYNGVRSDFGPKWQWRV